MRAERGGALEGWRALRSSGQLPVGGGIPVKFLEASTARGVLRVALGATGAPRLLVPVEPGTRQTWFSGAAALNVAPTTLVVDAVPVNFIDITCTDLALEGVFADVCDAIAARIANGESIGPACTRTLSEFADLFRPEPDDSTDPRKVRGLLGELLYLELLLERDPRALSLWVGPSGEPQDFRGGKYVVEVKTVGRANAGVTISSLEQLAVAPGESLHLHVRELVETTGGGMSVAEVVDRALQLCDDRPALRSMIALQGFSATPGTPWVELRFNTGPVRQWRVVGGFPLITRDSLRVAVPGLIDATYTIHPSDAVDCEVDVVGQNAMLDSLVRTISAV